MATSSIDPTPRVRPPKLIYAVDEWPPPLQLALLGAQYAVMSAIYLVLVAIVLRSAKVAEADTVGLMGIACVALAVGTFLQACRAARSARAFSRRRSIRRPISPRQSWRRRSAACRWSSA